MQTIGWAGQSIAAGVAFTIPALIYLSTREQYFNDISNIFALSIGGILGVLFMVPLRRALIVKEHGVLPYPRRHRLRDVLVAGERGGSLAKKVLRRFAMLYKIPMSVLGLWKETPPGRRHATRSFRRATVASDVTPEYLASATSSTADRRRFGRPVASLGIW